MIEFDFHKGFKKGSSFLQNLLFYVFGHWGMVSIIYLFKKIIFHKFGNNWLSLGGFHKPIMTFFSSHKIIINN
jgi:hypothetical protein